jgi:hypothetical protein
VLEKQQQLYQQICAYELDDPSHEIGFLDHLIRAKGAKQNEIDSTSSTAPRSAATGSTSAATCRCSAAELMRPSRALPSIFNQPCPNQHHPRRRDHIAITPDGRVNFLRSS